MFLSSIIRNNKTETNQISINYRTDKQKVIYLYNEILLHSKKGFTDISYDVNNFNNIMLSESQT